MEPTDCLVLKLEEIVDCGRLLVLNPKCSLSEGVILLNFACENSACVQMMF